MSDPAVSEPSAEATKPPSELCDQISRSLGTVWRDNGGGRPSVSTEVRGDVIKCVVTSTVEELVEGEVPDEDAVERSTTSVRYRTNAMAAIRKTTHRKVLAYIPKRNKDTEVATETFIVDRSLGRQG